MSREILVHKYQLRRKQDFKTKAVVVPYEGALLCVDGGYACLHPWVEYGDLSLDEQLAKLKQGDETPLLKKALYFASEDKKAREQRRSLFQSQMEIPRSHALVTDLTALQGDLHTILRNFVEDGFSKIKIKIGSIDIEDQIKNLEKLTWAAEGKDLKFRLDFNGKIAFTKLEEILSRFSPSLLNRIDFLEDPCPFNAQQWSLVQNKFKIRLGIDWYDTDGVEGFEIFVVKPARQDGYSFCQKAADQMKRIVLTSYMDHPVGQMFAAWEAAKVFQDHPLLIDDCGLTTHFLFESDEFVEQVKTKGSQLLPVEGTGIGFDDTLKKLEWKKL